MKRGLDLLTTEQRAYLSEDEDADYSAWMAECINGAGECEIEDEYEQKELAVWHALVDARAASEDYHASTATR